jgi:Protein of unknown function (DUF2794)
LAAIGQQYDSINEFVRAAGKKLSQFRLPLRDAFGSCRRAAVARSSDCHKHEAPMIGDTEPGELHGGEAASHLAPANRVTFDRRELNRILGLYGRMVAAGEWRDYAIDFLKDRAVFSVFRRASEVPIYRIEKHPRLARRHGAYSVISATGLIMRRGHELERVLRVLDRPLSLAVG